jgi:IS30 family transposase
LAHNELAPWGDTRSFFLFSFAQNMVLSTTEKAQIVALHKAGRSNAQLAEQFGVSVVTIKKTKRHFNERGHYERKKGSGRKKKAVSRGLTCTWTPHSQKQPCHSESATHHE